MRPDMCARQGGVIVEVPVSSEANTSTRLLLAAIPMLRAVLP